MRVLPPLLVIGGPAGSGKTSIASEVGKLAHAPVVDLGDSGDDDPHAVDLPALQLRLDAHEEARMVVVEGVYALALPPIRWAAKWTVYVDTPLDLSLARRALDHRDPAVILRAYLAGGRETHLRTVATGRQLADLVVDGSHDLADVAGRIHRFLLTRA
ncbi:hypothetical protein GCM10018962_78710 [Dactylosporangium matsuzakiense]|uniref:AAA domain-containing protein n=2 Tax=Dactylosporangium TaxID=35753 RepID=A0A9W6NLX2_9ACTN|nr:hypothetical protein GCM10017581_033580 [Dactylosporangium matsuzakiense]